MYMYLFTEQTFTNNNISIHTYKFIVRTCTCTCNDISIRTYNNSLLFCT